MSPLRLIFCTILLLQSIYLNESLKCYTCAVDCHHRFNKYINPEQETKYISDCNNMTQVDETAKDHAEYHGAMENRKEEPLKCLYEGGMTEYEGSLYRSELRGCVHAYDKICEEEDRGRFIKVKNMKYWCYVCSVDLCNFKQGEIFLENNGCKLNWIMPIVLFLFSHLAKFMSF